ncbi:unnamed protein product, partial [marine sediment metagenome]
MIKQSFGGAMALAQRTWDGQMKTMMGKWDVFLDSIAQSGVLEWFTSGLQTINEEWDELVDTGKVDEWASAISDAIINISKRWAVIIKGLRTAYSLWLNIGITIDTLNPTMIKLRAQNEGWKGQLRDVRKQLSEIKKEGMAPDPGAWNKFLGLMDEAWEKLSIPPVGFDVDER